MSHPKSFTVPKYDSLEHFFNEKFQRDFSPQEQNIVNFFHHHIATAIEKNIETSSLQLCMTMIFMLSPENRQNFCLERQSFGADDKRNAIAKTIKALFSENMDDLNEQIQKTNDETRQEIEENYDIRSQYRLFEKVDACTEAEKSAMKEFCTDYTISLASKIFAGFGSQEISAWQKSTLPTPHALLNHPTERLSMLGHRQEEAEQETASPTASIANPYGYSLRTQGVKRSREAG